MMSETRGNNTCGSKKSSEFEEFQENLENTEQSLSALADDEKKAVLKDLPNIFKT